MKQEARALRGLLVLACRHGVLLGELSRAVLDDEAIEHSLHDALFFEGQGGNGLEQQREAIALRPALVWIEHQDL